MLFKNWKMLSEFCETQNFDKNLAFLWNFSIWEYGSLKTLETNLEIRFVEHILDAIMKRATDSWRAGIHYLFGSIFLFLCDFKIQMVSIICVFICYLITTFVRFAVISMSSNAYFIRYHFNIGGFFVNRNKNKLFWGHLKTAYDVNFFRIGLDLDSLILILNFDIF